jgi:hypothetical protein
MPLLVTSAFGADGDGCGALLAFDRNGAPRGAFLMNMRDRLYLNGGQDRVLAVGAEATVLRDPGPIEGLTPVGGISGQLAGITSGCRSVIAFEPSLDADGEQFPRNSSCAVSPRVCVQSRRKINSRLWDGARMRWATTLSLRLIQASASGRSGLSAIQNSVPSIFRSPQRQHRRGERAPDAITTVRE